MNGILSRLGPHLREAMAWWASGLWACVPVRLQRVIMPAPRLLVVEEAGGSMVQICVSDRDDGPSYVDLSVLGRLSLRKQLGIGRLGRYATVLAVLAERCLRTEIEIPRAASAHLNSAVRFEIERLLPYEAGQLVVHARPTNAWSRDDRLHLSITCADWTEVGGTAEQLEAAGLAPQWLLLGDLAPSWNNLLPTDTVGFRRRVRRAWRVTTTLSLSFALLMTATFYFAIRAGIEEHDALQSELRSLLAIHRQAEDLRGQISEAQARASFLQRQRADAVPIVASMSKIARALPDDGWVEQITFENGVITLRGYAKDAAQAQQRLNSELDATDIRFAAPVVRDDRTGSDRFVLEIRHRRPASG